MVNTDRAFEINLKKAGLSLDLRGKSDDEYAHIRKKAKDVTARGMEGYQWSSRSDL